MVLSTAILYVASSTFIIYLLKWIFFRASNYMKLIKLPGPPHSNLLIGNVSYLGRSPERNFIKLREVCKKYYPIYKLFALHVVCANILTPEDAEIILSNSIHNEKGQVYNIFKKWLRGGLVTSNGARWQTRRKILTPAFHFSILQDFIHVFNEESEQLVEVLKKESSKSYVHINPIMTQFTLKTIAETAMGTKLHFKTQQEKDYRQAIHDIIQIFLYRVQNPWFVGTFFNYFSPKFLKECRVTKTLHDFTKAMIQKREKVFKDIELPRNEHDVYKGKKRLAMLDLLLSAKNEGLIDDEGIHEEVDTFTFAGHESSATTLGFLLMLLACHKDAQEQIVQEMREVLGDLRKKPTYAELQELKFLERCIKETLRLYPGVQVILRTTGEALTTHSGYYLPKKTLVAVHIYDIHHNPEVYPDPEKFDPDRFLPENSHNRHPYAFLPFSAGPRNCLGQKFVMLELKAAMCAILGNFFVEPIDTPETIVLIVDMALRAKEGVKVRFVPRT